MLAEFARPDAPDNSIGRAIWDGRGTRVEADETRDRAAIERVFRRTPVTVDDPAIRSAGASGPVTLQPGTLQWFIDAARTRSADEGLVVRLVSARRAGGWDPAAAYRTFPQAIDRLERLASRPEGS